MTDYAKVIECLVAWADSSDMGRKPDPDSIPRQATAAIEALIAERDAYQQAADKMASEHKVGREALQAENERLKRQLEISKQDAKEWYSQADALKAKLDAAPKAPEPLTAKEDWDIRGILASKLRVFHRTTEAEADELISLFSSMKSRTSLTQPEVVEAFCNTPHNVQYVSVFDAGVRFAEKHHEIGENTCSQNSTT